jgi:hypothetical protein
LLNKKLSSNLFKHGGFKRIIFLVLRESGW